MPKVNSATAATLNTEIGGNTYAAPPSAAHRQILSALVAAGVLTTGGAYVGGKGQADILKVLSTPSIVQETLERVCLTRGI